MIYLSCSFFEASCSNLRTSSKYVIAISGYHYIIIQLFAYPFVFFMSRDFGEEIAVPTMLQLYDQAVRVLKQIINWHIVQCAYWVILGLKYQEWDIDLRHKSVAKVNQKLKFLP